MGMNYYLKRKINYNKRAKTPHTLGISNDNSIIEINNGYVFNNKYYKNEKELNKEFYQLIHIGKSSAGWKFTLAIYPKYGIKDINDWIELFKSKGVEIYDENGEIIKSKEMIKEITKKKGDLHIHPEDEYTINIKGATYDYVISGRNTDEGVIFA